MLVLVPMASLVQTGCEMQPPFPSMHLQSVPIRKISLLFCNGQLCAKAYDPPPRTYFPISAGVQIGAWRMNSSGAPCSRSVMPL